MCTADASIGLTPLADNVYWNMIYRYNICIWYRQYTRVGTHHVLRIYVHTNPFSYVSVFDPTKTDTNIRVHTSVFESFSTVHTSYEKTIRFRSGEGGSSGEGGTAYFSMSSDLESVGSSERKRKINNIILRGSYWYPELRDKTNDLEKHGCNDQEILQVKKVIRWIKRYRNKTIKIGK